MTDAEIQAYMDNECEVAAELGGMGPGERDGEFEDGDGEEQVKPE